MTQGRQDREDLRVAIHMEKVVVDIYLNHASSGKAEQVELIPLYCVLFDVVHQGR